MRLHRDIIAMSLRGWLQLGSTGLLLFIMGYSPLFMVGGLLMGPIYWLGWRVPSTTANFEEGTEIGEAGWGVLVALLACLTVVPAIHRGRGCTCSPGNTVAVNLSDLGVQLPSLVRRMAIRSMPVGRIGGVSNTGSVSIQGASGPQG